MLAALLENNNNTQPSPRPSPRLPTVRIDRGGGGPSWPSYEITDIIAAISAFQEVPGENPVARAVRRHRWIGDALPGIKEAREKREAATFLLGATLASAVASEEHHAVLDQLKAEAAAVDAQRAIMDQLKIEQLVEIIDSVRGEPSIATAKARTQIERGERGDHAGGFGIFVGIVGGIAVGLLIGSTRKHGRRAG
jgi:hypothetical protein